MDPSDFLSNLNNTAESYRQRVQAQVKYCPTCQPYDEGDYIWIFGEETTLKEIFRDLNVPERYWEDIAAHIHCDNCGASGFGPWDTVGTEDRCDILRQKHLKAAERKYGKQVDKLQEYLEQYPFLTLSAPLGRTIYREITQGKPPTCIIQGEWFRTRRKKDRGNFSLKDMKAPPIGCAGDGRYNHAGQSVMYLSEDLETSMCEAIEDVEKSTEIWVQIYKLEDINNILDLTNDWENYYPTTGAIIVALLSSRVLSRKVTNRGSRWKPEYFVTRFIADCARLAGYAGIQYDSTRGYGNNVVLFGPESLPIKAEGKPALKTYTPAIKKPHYVIDDF